MKQIDWGLVKIQYEIFGEEPRDLATEYDTTTRMIEYAAKEGEWKRLPVAEALRDWSSLPDEGELLDEVKERSNILFLLKQETLNPRYIALEAAILGKAQHILQSLPAEPAAAGTLKTISDIYLALRPASGNQSVDQKSEGVKILIQNQVEGPGVRQITPPEETTVVIDGVAARPREVTE